MSSPDNLVLVQDYESIRHLTINRPQDRNSINTPLMQQLDQLLARTEAEGFRAVVISGAGETYFVGGADGIEMMRCDTAGAQTLSARIQALFNRMEQSPLILVAAIDGLCFGGGFELAMACDLRFAGENARIRK